MSITASISIVFYKGEGTLAEKLIRLWTKSPYAHCEFGRSDGLFHSNDRFRFISRTHAMEINPLDWDVCEIELPCEIIDRVEKRQLKKNGTSYDWVGIVFSQVFRLGWHSKKRWFCSKSNADDLVYAYRLMERTRFEGYQPYLDRLSGFKTLRTNECSPQVLYQALTSSCV
ncbi:MAG: hypothetical protein PHW18_00660 [Sulfuricurvum sp.]|uniref:hypothetical protein n=1 Tax=Sulfuricurvum sp. TaxID=2025608 RepID=UPI00262B2DAA|nr:hypothetical protein [Sulfuricurvum sp.]MDD2828067.1 hypothetical protein [Sulfuricurvum sp.]